MIRLCAFSDEASDSLEGQIAALLRNNIKLTELRSVGGVNVKDFTNEQAEAYAKQLAESGIRVWAIGCLSAKRIYRKILRNTKKRCAAYAKSRIYSGAIRYEFSVFITLIVRAKKCLKIFVVW